MASHPRSRLVAAVALALVATQSLAGARVLDPTRLVERELPNGLRILVLPQHDVPVVAVDAVLRGGSSLEGPDERGLAHILEHMIFQRPAAPSPAGLLPYTIESQGGEILGDTSRDSIELTVTVAPQGFTPCLEALAEALLRPSFEESRLRPELGIMGKELREAYALPLTRVRDAAYREIHGDGPYGRSPGGGPEELPAYTVDDLRAYYAKHVVARNLAIVVVGDVIAEDVLAAVERTFGAMPAGESTLPPAGPVPPPQPRTVGVLLPAGSSPMAALAWPAPGMGESRDVLACDVLLALLDDGSSGPLHTELPQRLPLFRAAGAGYLTQRMPGLVSLWAAADGVPTDIAAALRASVAGLLTNGPSPDECVAATRSALLAHAQTCDTYTGQAQCIGFYEAIGSGRFAFDYEDEVVRVTPQQVRDLAIRRFAPDQALVLLAKPEGAAQ